MGKRIKPSNLLQDSDANDADINAEKNVVQNDEQEAIDANSIIAGNRLDAESRKKLEKYDAMSAAIASLNAEKQELQDKVAEYAEKLASLNDASNEINKLKSEIEDLKKQLESSKASSNDVEVAMLKKECKTLRDEADGYLVKISELTFENANLTCQLDELGRKNASRGNINNQPKFAPNGSNVAGPGNLAQPYQDAYNPYKNNGYGTW